MSQNQPAPPPRSHLPDPDPDPLPLPHTHREPRSSPSPPTSFTPSSTPSTSTGDAQEAPVDLNRQPEAQTPAGTRARPYRYRRPASSSRAYTSQETRRVETHTPDVSPDARAVGGGETDTSVNSDVGTGGRGVHPNARPRRPSRPTFFVDDSLDITDTEITNDTTNPFTSPSEPTPSSSPPETADSVTRDIVDTHPIVPPPTTMPTSTEGYEPLDPSTTSRPSSPASPTSSSTPPPPPRTPPILTHPKPLRAHNPNPNPPPSSFAYTYAAAFPFQAYAGNPDPGFSIPGFTSRRRSGTASSLDSFGGGGYSGAEREREREDGVISHSGSLTDLRKPFAPFMAGAGAGGGENTSTSSSTSLNGTIPRSSSSNSLYKGSAAANLTSGQQAQQAGPQTTTTNIPRNASTHSFRAPFLAPSSRPTSSLWSPPNYSLPNSPNPNGTPPNPNGTGNGIGTGTNTLSPNASTTALAAYQPTSVSLALKPKPPLPSTLLRAPIPPSEKPWLLPASTKPSTKSPGPIAADASRTSLSYWLTLLLILLGAAASAIQCYTGLTSLNPPIPSHRLCPVLTDDFTSSPSGLLDTTNNYNLELALNGFGTGAFEMTTADPGNIYVDNVNGELVIMPTLTSDKVQGVMSGGSYTLEGCTSGSGLEGGIASLDPGAGNKANGGLGGGGGNANGTGACTVTSNDALGTVINPIQSARLNTRGKKSIRYGKVEVRAKLPRGDWLWPQIFLLPSDPSTYGTWPVSGELDMLLARGNDPAGYPAQGNTYVRSSMSLGALPGIASSSLLRTTFGFLSNRHPTSAGKGGYTTGFHTYTLEWTEEFIRFSVDSPTRAVLEVSTRARKPQFGFGAKAVEGRSYWNQAGFPVIAKGVGGGGGAVEGTTTTTTAAAAAAANTTTPNGNNTTTTIGTTNTTTSTNSTNIARALPHLLPAITNTTHTNTSSSSPSPSPSSSSTPNTNSNTNTNTNTNPADTITPITNPYTSNPSSTPAAPFDQPFYLVVGLGVGGTSGWFPDGVGGKMWFDGSATAMRDFARAQDTWYKTWPASAEDRALRIDYIKMWELC